MELGPGFGLCPGFHLRSQRGRNPPGCGMMNKSQ
jgi:hypothetical protein